MLADKGSISRVSSTVVSQMTLGSEGLPAVGVLALERLFPRVDSHVRLQVSSFGKSFIAILNWTHEGLLASL